MKKDNEMEEIQRGLEKFLDQEMNGPREKDPEDEYPEEEEPEDEYPEDEYPEAEVPDEEETEYGCPEKNMKKRDKKGRRKKKGGFGKAVRVLAVLVVFFFLVLYMLVSLVYGKMNYRRSEELAGEPLKENGVISVLLIGSDSRTAGDEGRSDAMILLTISRKTKTIRMTSLLRDMYVEIPGHEGNRLNAAYAYGGAQLLLETVNQNFDLHVNRYAVVNFSAFANLVDAVGGVDLELTNEEVVWVNAYLNEYNELRGMPMETDYLDASLSGNIHLNGAQALAYCRNRYIGTDFGRTQRQRNVLEQVLKKLPLAALTNPVGLVDGLFPNLTTNLTKGECMQLSLAAGSLLTYELVQDGIPLEGTYSNATIREMAVLQVDFEQNKAYLRKEIYGEE